MSCPSFVHRLSIVYTRPFEVNLRKMLNLLMNITQEGTVLLPGFDDEEVDGLLDMLRCD